MSQIEMEHEHHQEQGPAYQENSGHWINAGHVYQPSSHHQSPVHEYNGFQFTPLPMEPMYGRGMPPPRTTHQQLQPLVMPQMPQWPSMLTSQSTYVPPTFSTAQVPVPPALTPISASSAGSRPASTSRKTLTDADRRRMCQYHEEHPSVKQTEIGAMFGVERSTVSKVLRNKEKYLHQEDGSRSPARKSKGKFPDIERALSNWVRNHQKQGLAISDAMIREKARFFATSVGNPESHMKANSTSWLEKFKQRNNLGHIKTRKGSLAEYSEDCSYPCSNSNTPNGISPTSPVISPSSVSMSATKSEDGIKHESSDDFVDFIHGHRPFHSQSNTSLSSVFTDTAPSSFSPGPQSPTSPFFTPDSTCGPSPFIPTQHPRGAPPMPSGGNDFQPQQRPRSQTFPMGGIEPYVSPPQSSESLTPRHFSSTALDSPLEDMPLPSTGGSSDETIHPLTTSMDSIHTLTAITTRAPGSTAQPSTSPVTPQSSDIATPTTPSQDDARRALELVMNYFQSQPSGFVEPQDYMTIGKLMEKLKLQRAGEMPGGMYRIPSADFIRNVD